MSQKLSPRQRRTVLATTITLLLGLSSSASAISFTEALTGGKPKLDVRLRYENVDQDNATDDADALTVRTRLGYGTGSYRNFNAYVEMENNSALVEDYNSGPGGNGKTRYSVVADPDATEVNQAYLGFDGLPDTSARLGRQRIILDNARFVGNVGWRQLEQTYDAVLAQNKSLPDTTLTYSYIDNVKNIFSNDADVNTHLVNAGYDGLGFARIVAYGYFIEFNSSTGIADQSNQTLGAYLDGSYDFGGFKLLYRAEYAQQSDYDNGNSDIDADYNHFILGATVKGVTAKVGYELLGDDDAFSFETPLATKHAFNGWADIFLNTPADGLQDVYALVSGKVMGVKLMGVYHDFQSDKGSTDYGTEIDLLAAKKFSKNYTAGIKYASYDSDDYAVDTDKFWLWGQMKF
ncbi:MAG: alginate export family protein [Thiogranum sp.]